MIFVIWSIEGRSCLRIQPLSFVANVCLYQVGYCCSAMIDRLNYAMTKSDQWYHCHRPTHHRCALRSLSPAQVSVSNAARCGLSWCCNVAACSIQYKKSERLIVFIALTQPKYTLRLWAFLLWASNFFFFFPNKTLHLYLKLSSWHTLLQCKGVHSSFPHLPPLSCTRQHYWLR